jgi:hypothetical protein
MDDDVGQRLYHPDRLLLFAGAYPMYFLDLPLLSSPFLFATIVTRMKHIGNKNRRAKMQGVENWHAYVQFVIINT